MEIIVKNFQPHFNSALGKVITSERQYRDEVKKGGYIPYEEAQERDRQKTEERNKFVVSDKAVEWMRSVRSSADRRGNVKLSDQQVDFLKKGMTTNRENPVLKQIDNRLPEHYQKGGFR